MLKQFEEGAYNTELDLFDPLSKDITFQKLPELLRRRKRYCAGLNLPILSKEYRDKTTMELHKTKDDGQKIIPGSGLAEISETSFNVVKTLVQSCRIIGKI